MQKEYTTGEIARLCGVTKRTVQYYDKENIVTPAKMSDGGRRIYTEDDLKKFQLVCLYKDLGLSLQEIKSILESSNQYKVIMESLSNQREKIDNQIEDLKKLRDKSTTLYNEISMNQIISIRNEEELRSLCLRKKRHDRIDKLTYLLLCFYMIILILSCIVGSLLDGMFLAISIDVLLLYVLIYIHTTQNAYICPKCHKKFEITFLKDMLTLNNGKRGKYLKCPYCHQKSWIAETYKDN